MNKYLFLGGMLLLLAAYSSPEADRTELQARVNRVVPVVNEVELGTGWLPLAQIQTIVHDPELAFEAEWLHDALHDFHDFHSPVQTDADWQGVKAIQLRLTEDSTNTEGYSIRIYQGGIEVKAAAARGVFYGLQTLVQLLPGPTTTCGEPNFPFVTLSDAPRFEHRGLLLDCCRHFMEPEFVKKTIDRLAFYKMNVLHWHLTEDQGWRIQINAFPELTEHGAWRDDGKGGRYGGFYTQNQIRDIVAYAAERHVEIIPEIELPGHSSAAISAYPHLGCTGESIDVVTEWGVFPDVYCAGNDQTVSFLKTVMDEVVTLFPSPYIHIGGDEAPVQRWEECEKCQRRIQTMGLENEHALQGWLITEIAQHLEAQGKTIIGWDEILEAGDLPPSAVVQSWRGMDGGKEAVAHGRQAIMSPTSHCYFDYPLSSTDVAEVFTFNPIPEGLSPQQQSLILGGECNMWTERAPQDIVESKIYPRLLAMSEVLWRKDTTARSYEQFTQALNQQYDLLDFYGVEYGFPSEPLEVSVTREGKALHVQLQPLMEGMEVYQLQADGNYLGSSLDTVLVDNWEWEVEPETSSNPAFIASFRGKMYNPPLMLNVRHHKAVGASCQVPNGYSDSYSAGGSDALIDGVQDPGAGDYRSGCWQGVQGKDVVAIIDLGKRTEIHQLETHFQEYANAWIFLPTSVQFELSMDGEKWTEVPMNPRTEAQLSEPGTWNGRMQNMQEIQHKRGIDQMFALGLIDRVEPQFSQTFDWRGDAFYARYLRMTAHNRGVCPKGHPAEGQPAWLFCDEIVVN